MGEWENGRKGRKGEGEKGEWEKGQPVGKASGSESSRFSLHTAASDIAATVVAYQDPL